MFASSGTFGCHDGLRQSSEKGCSKHFTGYVDWNAGRKVNQDEIPTIAMARLQPRCCELLKKDETETRIEKKPLKNPASHKPEKKDDISLNKGVRHKESCSGSEPVNMR